MDKPFRCIESPIFISISGFIFILTIFASGALIKENPEVFQYLNFGFDSSSLISPLFSDDSADRPPNHYNPRKFFPGESEPFIQYSAYRTSSSRITLIGLGVATLKNNHTLGPCVWYGNDGKIINGSLHYGYSGASTLYYEEEMFHCHLKKNSGDAGGYLVMHLNGEERITFEEDAGKAQNLTEPARFNRTFCSAPLHGSVDGRAVFEWMEYHRVMMGLDRYVLYDANGMDDEFMGHIQPYVDAGMAKVVDFTEILQFDVFYFAQVMANWDCMYSVALDTQWVFLHDMDEYLFVLPPHSLSSLLEENKRMACMSMGRMDFTIDICNDKKGNNSFIAERMVYRDFDVFCYDYIKKFPKEMCLHWYGLRKLIINPRKVLLTQVHMVVLKYGGDVKHFNASSEIRYDHFRSILVKNETLRCQQVYSDETIVNWRFRDYSLAKKFEFVKSSPLTPH